MTAEFCACCDITWYFMGGFATGLITFGFVWFTWVVAQWDRSEHENMRKQREKEELTPRRGG